MNKIGHFFRWLFEKEDNTWEDYCLKNGLVKEEPKEKSEPIKKTISLEKTIEQVKKSGAEKPVVVMSENEFEYYTKKQSEWEVEKIERCKQTICNYMYDCNESKTAVNDLLYNNRDAWFIVSDGLDSRSKLITESLEYLTGKKWKFLGEVQNHVYAWKVDSKMLDKINLEK